MLCGANLECVSPAILADIVQAEQDEKAYGAGEADYAGEEAIAVWWILIAAPELRPAVTIVSQRLRV